MNRRNKTNALGDWLSASQKKIIEKKEHPSALYAITGHFLKKTKEWVLSHSEHVLTLEEENKLNSALNRLIAGEPLPYIVGYQPFYKRDFIVSPDVLIPRPETELLIELAVKTSKRYSTPITIADVGTGSGCIAITLANEIPLSHITATEVSPNALAVARMNAKKFQVENKIDFINTNLLDGIEKTFDMICANLPYIPSKILDDLKVIEHEPRLALDGGESGLTLISTLLKDLPRIIKKGGTVFLEIEQTLGNDFLKICRDLTSSASVRIMNDLAGLPRIAILDFSKEEK